MSEYIIKYPGLSKYASINEKGVLKWDADADTATGFASSEDARKAFAAAQEFSLATAQKKLAAAKASGKMVNAGHRYSHATNQYESFQRHPRLDDYSNAWSAPGFDAEFEARASRDDLTGTFEMFFVRSPYGWLGTPLKKSRWNKYEWNASFHQATPFMTLDAAAAAVEEEYDFDYAIVKTTAAITGVQAYETGRKPRGTIDDELSCALSCAVEARDIETTIKQAAEERAKSAAAKAAAAGTCDAPEAQEPSNPKARARI